MKIDEKDEDLRAMDSELYLAQKKTNFLKKEVRVMKRQLEGAYDIDKIVAMEN